jgi:2-dehydropantoate 2-reductase
MSAKTVCVFGAGAIGSLLGGHLARAGEKVSLIARGRHLEAMQSEGLRLISKDGETVVHPQCHCDAARLGVQDFVILTVKAHALHEAAAALQPLLGPETVIVSAANGVPWWYFYRVEGELANHRLATIDPDGTLWERLPPERALGCVVHAAGEIVAPGVVKWSGKDFRLGDPGGRLGPELAELSRMITEAGLAAPICPDIRQEVWNKLWGNATFNPLSVLTGAMLDRLAGDPDTKSIARQMMIEMQTVGGRLGIRFPMDVDRRIAVAEAIGPHKTSMLQDLERGRTLEIDALLGVVIEMAGLVGVAAPVCELILGLVRQRARVVGLYGP